MEANWMVLCIIAFCAIILIVYMIRRNLQDKEEVTKYFNEEVKTDKDFDNDEEL